MSDKTEMVSPTTEAFRRLYAENDSLRAFRATIERWKAAQTPERIAERRDILEAAAKE